MVARMPTESEVKKAWSLTTRSAPWRSTTATRTRLTLQTTPGGMAASGTLCSGTPRMLRTVGTEASPAPPGGVGVREVAKFLGHPNTMFTDHIYTLLFDIDDHAGAVAALDAIDVKLLPEDIIRVRNYS
jgi:hypothetical protein